MESIYRLILNTIRGCDSLSKVVKAFSTIAYNFSIDGVTSDEFRDLMDNLTTQVCEICERFR